MISDKLKGQILAHARSEFPRESCGLIVLTHDGERYHLDYVPCRNIAESLMEFAIDPEDYARAEDAGEVTAIVHSHCNVNAEASQADLVGCERSGLPWVIVSLPTETWNRIEPTGYRAPLVGREFSHGVLDCFSLVRDFYLDELGIEVPDFERAEKWWERGGNLYLENYQKAGFIPVDPKTLKRGDIILMAIRSPVPNHAAIYLGNGQILHHLQGRLSTREVWGGFYHKIARGYFRHRDL